MTVAVPASAKAPDESSTVGDGLIIGDTVTREFSIWGAVADVGSPADDTVRASKGTAAGRAAVSALSC